MFTPTKFKIWYVHQIPGTAYEREVPDPQTGALMLDAIYSAMVHAFDHKMIPDYCNTGGIVYKDEDGDWIDYDPEEWEVA